MQLPGMSYDPVRLSLEVTFWPDDASFSLSRHLWTRPHRGSVWVLEDMATTGSPIPLSSLRDRWNAAADLSLTYFEELIRIQGDPF